VLQKTTLEMHLEEIESSHTRWRVGRSCSREREVEM
jgi:hypothetical protein